MSGVPAAPRCQFSARPWSNSKRATVPTTIGVSSACEVPTSACGSGAAEPDADFGAPTSRTERTSPHTVQVCARAVTVAQASSTKRQDAAACIYSELDWM